MSAAVLAAGVRPWVGVLVGFRVVAVFGWVVFLVVWLCGIFLVSANRVPHSETLLLFLQLSVSLF